MKPLPRWAGLALFGIGFALLFVLNLNLLITGQEADLFDSGRSGEAPLTSLRCPHVMARNETVTITATFDNPTDNPLVQIVRLHVAEGNMLNIEERYVRLDLPPGVSHTIPWLVKAENPIYGRLVLLRAHALLNNAYPYRQASCGIFVLPFGGLRGEVVLWVWSGLGLLSMALGLGIWVWQRLQKLEGRPRRTAGLMLALGLLSLVIWLLALTNGWLVGQVLILFNGLLLLIGIGQILIVEHH